MMNEDEKRESRKKASKKYYQKTKGVAQKLYRERNKEKVAIQQKDRREKLKAEGRCVVCGITPLVSQTMCQKCVDRCKDHYYGKKSFVYERYGSKCSCCGETEEAFLTIDHVNNDGAAHRKTFASGGGYCIYSWLVENNFPEGFQILCWNCQWGKNKHGTCPHQNPASPSYLGERINDAFR